MDDKPSVARSLLSALMALVLIETLISEPIADVLQGVQAIALCVIALRLLR